MRLNMPSSMTALIVSLASVCALAQDSQTLRTVTIHTDDVVGPPPQTLAERLGRADAVIRGRVVRSDVRYQREAVPPGVDPAYGIQPETEQTVEVLDIVKDHLNLPIPSRTVTVVQPVGTVIVDGVRVVKDSDKMRGWLPGEEVVLFLRWDRSHAAFTVRSENDCVLLSNGVVSTQGDSPVAKALHGVPVPQFLAELKAAAAR
jgi:hypothetical protein